MRIPGVVGPTYQGESTQEAAELCQNFYPEVVESDSVHQNPWAKVRYLLQPTPGFFVIAEIEGATSIEAMTETLGRLFVVARAGDADPVADTLYEIVRTGDASNPQYESIVRGRLPTPAAGPVSLVTMGDIGELLMVVANGWIHYYDLSFSVAETVVDDRTRGAQWAEFALPFGLGFRGEPIAHIGVPINLQLAPTLSSDAPDQLATAAGAGPHMTISLDWEPPDEQIGWWVVPYVEGQEYPGRVLIELNRNRTAFVNLNQSSFPVLFYGVGLSQRLNQTLNRREFYVVRFSHDTAIQLEVTLRLFPAIVTDAEIETIRRTEKWYTYVEGRAQFGGHIDGFFARLSTVRNELAVGPQFGLNFEGIGTGSVPWIWQESPGLAFGVGSAITCMAGNPAVNRLWLGASGQTAADRKLVAVALTSNGTDQKGQTVAADEVDLPAAFSAAPTGAAFAGDKLYLVNLADDRVFVFDATTPYARVDGDEFAFEWPSDAPNAFTPWERASIDVWVSGTYVYVLFRQRLGANSAENRPDDAIAEWAEIRCYLLADGGRVGSLDLSSTRLRESGATGAPTHLTGTGNILLLHDIGRDRIFAFDTVTTQPVNAFGSHSALIDWRRGSGNLIGPVWYDSTPTVGQEGTAEIGRVWLGATLGASELVTVFDLIRESSGGVHLQYEWDQLNALQRTTAPDEWKALQDLHNELIVLGSKTGDVLRNVGASPFPLQIRRDVFIQAGITAPHTLVECDKTLLWVGSTAHGTGEVYRLDNYEAVRISNHAVERALKSVSQKDLQGAHAVSYELDGHSFYLLQVPGLDYTWVFDATTALWHTRVDEKADGTNGRYRVNAHAAAFGRNVVGDARSGKLAILTTASWGNFDGEPVERIRVPPTLVREKRKESFTNLRLDVQVGAGLAEGEDRDIEPTVRFRWSYDDGETWGRAVTRSLGRAGATRGRGPQISNLGSGWFFTVEFRFKTLAPVRVFDGYIDVGGR